MNTKHTKGPWTIDPSMELGLAVIQDNEDGEGIAELGPQRTIENIANAKLIAAAPDLLEACQLVERAYVGDGVNMSVAVDACLLAIKKAGAE